MFWTIHKSFRDDERPSLTFEAKGFDTHEVIAAIRRAAERNTASFLRNSNPMSSSGLPPSEIVSGFRTSSTTCLAS